jgi:2-isopropylmalate synthase
MSEKVVVFDTTLRDGEQTAGVCFSARDKVEIARALADMRVDVIEAGFPAASAAERRAVAAVAREVCPTTSTRPPRRSMVLPRLASTSS